MGGRGIRVHLYHHGERGIRLHMIHLYHHGGKGHKGPLIPPWGGGAKGCIWSTYTTMEGRGIRLHMVDLYHHGGEGHKVAYGPLIPPWGEGHKVAYGPLIPPWGEGHKVTYLLHSESSPIPPGHHLKRVHSDLNVKLTIRLHVPMVT